MSAPRRLLLGAVLFSCLATVAPRESAADDSKLEEGYILLFNGKDLTGWELEFCPPGIRAKDLLELTVKDGKPTALLNGKAIAVDSRSWRELRTTHAGAGLNANRESL